MQKNKRKEVNWMKFPYTEELTKVAIMGEKWIKHSQMPIINNKAIIFPD